MGTQTKPKSFSSLYTAIKCHPGYEEWQDENGRKHNNAEELIPPWIWQNTNEEKWRKSDLTIEEYNHVVAELYALGGKKPRTRLAKSYDVQDPKDKARKALMAAWHERIKLLHEDKLPTYIASPTRYVIGCIMRTCGGRYKDINDIPLQELDAKARKIRAENTNMKNAI